MSCRFLRPLTFLVLTLPLPAQLANRLESVIRGEVLASGRPVHSASVLVSGKFGRYTARTFEGSYTVRVPPGEYQIEAALPDHCLKSPARVTVPEKAGEVLAPILYLIRSRGPCGEAGGPDAPSAGINLSNNVRLLISAGDFLVLASGSRAIVLDQAGRRLGDLLHQSEINDIAYSNRFGGRGAVLTGSDDDTAALWDVATGRRFLAVPHPTDVEAVAFHPSGDLFATGAGNTIRVWDSRGKQIRQIEAPSEVRPLQFTPDGNSIAVGAGASLLLFRLNLAPAVR